MLGLGTGVTSVLIGDAAHAVTPFVGQGMNAGFYDCLTMKKYFEETGNLEHAFAKFAKEIKPETDAIVWLAEENFYEYRHQEREVILKRTIDIILIKLFPNYFADKINLIGDTLFPLETIRKRYKIQCDIVDKIFLDSHPEKIESLLAKPGYFLKYE
jgi:kynurenine 3-monooxygenase